MELRHLRYFLAVREALNFTKAAAQLRVAQPALSRQVQDLEDEIGVDLLKRSPRGVTLTAEGKLFLDEVRELLKRADESVEKVRAPGFSRSRAFSSSQGSTMPSTIIVDPGAQGGWFCGSLSAFSQDEASGANSNRARQVRRQAVYPGKEDPRQRFP